MSNLVAIAYPDVNTAIQVRDRLMGMQRENLIKLEDAAVVEKQQDGKIKLHQVNSPTGTGAAWGAVWGGLIGLIFFMPLLGMAMGAAGGALGGAMSDSGVDDQFMKDLANNLKPGGAVLFLLIVQSTPDKVIPEVASYGGTIIKTSLSNEQEAHLKELVSSAQGAAQ
ncbi:DUF1269 domain-containing protein [Actinocorallia lasiicapitis]